MADDLHGYLTTTSTRRMGDSLDTSASSAATTLSLYDVSDFDEDGGSVLIAGTVYTYDTVDMDADTIHLTSGLLASAAADVRVDLWDPDAGVVVSEVTALVAVDDQQGDPVSAVLDYALTTLFDDTTLAYGQSVTIAPDGAGHRLVNVHGRTNQLRDALTNEWTTDSRAASAIWQATTTNPTLGNGTLVSRFRQIGRTVDWAVKITVGSTTNPGAGTWQLALPFTAHDILTGKWYGRGYDSGTIGTPVNVDMTTTSLLTLRTPATTAGAADRSVNGTVPFTWGSADVLYVEGSYESA